MPEKIVMEFTLNPHLNEAEKIGMILAMHSMYEGMMHLPCIQTSSYHNGYADSRKGQCAEESSFSSEAPGLVSGLDGLVNTAMKR